MEKGCEQMPQKSKRIRTEPVIIADLIRCGMTLRGWNRPQLAKAANVCANTVYYNLENPESMTLERAFVYFAALGIPTEDVLQALANSFADELAG